MENKTSKPLEKLGGVVLIAESGSYETASILLMLDVNKQTYEIPFTTKPKDHSLLRACIIKVATLVDAQPNDINLDKAWKFEETKNDTSFTIFLGRAKSDEKVALKSTASQWVKLSALHTIPLMPRDRVIHELLLNQLYKFLFPNVAPPKLNVVAPNPKPVSQSPVDTKRFVVHCKKSKYDVYIGRPNPTVPLSNKDCAWGNPFKIGEHGTREDVIRKYDSWIRGKPELVEKAKKELKGKVLACWCAPEACHGDVLARIANFEDNNILEVNVNDYVVHCKKSKYDIYIGRPNPAIKESYNAKWGNPFKKSEIGEKSERLRLYEEWILSKPELMQQAKQELKGKILGCWCVPEACHGHILARIANE